MRNVRKIIWVAGVVCVMLLGGLVSTHAFAGTNLVDNGGFELPDIPFGSYEILASIPGWTTDYGFSVEIRDHYGSYGTPYEGEQFLELDGYESSNILQNIDTIVGNFYRVSFAYAGRDGGETYTGNNEIDAYWDGQLLEELRTTTVHEWELKEYIVQASDTTSTLKFNDVGESTSYGGYLDAVSVELVPEPTTLLLLGLGGLMLRRRRAL